MRPGAVALILLLCACSSVHASSPRRTKVLEIGDSILRVIAPATVTSFGPAYKLSVFDRIERVGVFIPALAKAIRTQMPDVAVVELGSDDALADDPGWKAAFDGMVAAVVKVPCVEFVTVSLVTDYYARVMHPKNPGPFTVSIEWNAALRHAVATHPNFHLIDWASVALRKSFVHDGTHPTAAGTQWLASHYKSAVSADC